jgi:hypothetical protein
MDEERLPIERVKRFDSGTENFIAVSELVAR